MSTRVQKRRATARAALVRYASCLRQNGVDVPAPDTSGNGPVLDTKGIDTSSSKFKTAQSGCQARVRRRRAVSACLRVRPSVEPAALARPSLRLTLRSPTRHLPYQEPDSSTIEPDRSVLLRAAGPSKHPESRVDG